MEGLGSERRGMLVKSLSERVTLPGKNIWGHGTSLRETAERINREGIIVSDSYGLTEIAIPLTDHEHDSLTKAGEIVNASIQWPHKHARYIVLIDVHDGFKRGDVIDKTTVEGRMKTRIQPKFIPGFVDATTQEFIANPAYEPAAKPTGFQEIVQREPKSYTKPASNPPPTYSDAEIEDVW